MTDRPAADDTAAQPEGNAATAGAPELVPAEQVTAALEAAAEFKDRLLRALGTIEAELREHADVKMTALIEGVELTERELMKVLEKYGVTKFSPEGEKFDPNVHQAMYEVQTADLPPGHVAQVIQAGYMLGDRVLRPALVAAVKAAPKAPPSSANDTPAGAGWAPPPPFRGAQAARRAGRL